MFTYHSFQHLLQCQYTSVLGCWISRDQLKFLFPKKKTMYLRLADMMLSCDVQYTGNQICIDIMVRPEFIQS